MKKSLNAIALALTVSLLPLSAYALDITPDATRDLADPSYLPTQGKVQGKTSYQYGKSKWDVRDANDAFVLAADQKTNNITQNVAYGITDTVSVSVSDSYGTSTVGRGATSERKANGFENPTIGATWRVIDQKTNPVSVDLLASYSPDVFNAKGATETQDGTVARGGYVVGGGTAVSYRTRAFTIYGAGGAVYRGDTETENQTTGVKTKLNDSNWNYLLSLQTQTRLTSLVSLDAGVSHVFRDKANTSFRNGAGTLVSRHVKAGDITALNVGLNYTVIKNRLVAGLTYEHDIIDDSVTSYANPANNITRTDDTANIYGAKLTYLLN